MNPPSPINVSHHLFLGLKEREQPTGLHADLEFVGKKSFKEPDNWDQLSDETKENLRLHHNWVNMLTVVPGISDAKARRIASVYPSAHALMDEYLDERVSERTRQLLLQDLFRENSGGGGGGGGGKGKGPSGGTGSSALLLSQSTGGKGAATMVGKGAGGNAKTGSSSAKPKSSNKPLVATKTMRQVTPLTLPTHNIYPYPYQYRPLRIPMIRNAMAICYPSEHPPYSSHYIYIPSLKTTFHCMMYCCSYQNEYIE